MKNTKSKALNKRKGVGYQSRDPIAHRKYSFKTAINRYKRSGKLTYRGKGALRGSGHRAGERWAEQKNIDHESPETKYSKNSPSFDEGVWLYKNRKKLALSNKQD